MNKFLTSAIFLALLAFGIAAQNRKVNNRAARISPNTLRAQIMRDGLREELKGCGSLSGTRIASQNIDLNSDGLPEIIAVATSGCFGARGSKVWIYRVINGRLSALLTMRDGAFEAASAATTNGFRDITLVSGSYTDVYKYTYKYGGRVYGEAGGRRYGRNERGVLVLQEIF